MNYPMYSNQYYLQDLQNMKDRIDNQIRQIQQTQQQQQAIPQVTQNFQIAPTQNTVNELEAKYANSIDEVKNTFVMKLGVFVNKDFTNLWIKDVNGKIRTFNTVEIVEMDEKDKEIFNLKKQIEEMKGMITNESSSINSDFDEPNGNQVAKRISTNKKSNAK
jgi:pyruvate/oxaloacetate carboxyltransferase